VLVMNGDSFCQADLKAFYAWHQQQKGRGSLLLTRVPDTGRYGQVKIKPDGQIHSFVEKGEVSGPGWISAGVYLLERDLLQTIPAGRPVSIEKEMFPAWIEQGLYGYQSEGRFLDIGTPESYALAETFFADHQLHLQE
jgi:NDP-sugar pyrophosphorylase family protein